MAYVPLKRDGAFPHPHLRQRGVVTRRSIEGPMNPISALPPAPIGPPPLDSEARERLAELFAELCIEAGAAIMEIYRRGCENVRVKADRSPVSEADEIGEAIILRGLVASAPALPIVAEEACAKGGKPPIERRFILVDPLDGTREFLSRNGEFTVNIGLVENGVPVVGAVYAPVLGRLWMAGRSAFAVDVAPGQALPGAAHRRRLETRPAPPSGWTALASRSHADEATEIFLSRLPVGERRSAGSSLKFCVLADGEADVYPRFGPTMEWDTAAGDAVLRAAGGIVLDPHGAPFDYGKADYRNGPFVAWADPSAVKA